MKTDGSKVFIPLLFRFLAWVTRIDFLEKKVLLFVHLQSF